MLELNILLIIALSAIVATNALSTCTSSHFLFHVLPSSTMMMLGTSPRFVLRPLLRRSSPQILRPSLLSSRSTFSSSSSSSSSSGAVFSPPSTRDPPPAAAAATTTTPLPTIQLNHKEAHLFETLSNAAKQHPARPVLRIAGGWVRDKLLSSFSTTSSSSSSSSSSPPSPPALGVDIDVTLSNMMGLEFANALNAHLVSSGVPARSFGVMAVNPEKSKHLETATMALEGFMLDFVNLRSEEYTSAGGRTPTAFRIGTATEDALRRDLTINSLFYNLETGSLEDLTGRGLPDLLRGLVRTPLPPRTTLLDDPLRVLRAVRFACRLGFEIDEELGKAAKDPEVKEALRAKVSRERVGDEVDKMLGKWDSAVRAVRTLDEFGLADVVFPDNEAGGDKLFKKGVELLAAVKRCKEGVEGELWFQGRCKDDDRILAYSAVTQPWRDEDFSAPITTGSSKKTKNSATNAVLKSLRRPTREVSSILKLHAAARSFSSLSSLMSASSPPSRYDVALAMRSAGGRWRCALLLAFSSDLLSEPSSGGGEGGVEARYRALAKRIVDTGLVEGYDAKIPLSGEEVKRDVLRKIVSGPAYGLVTEAQLQWVLNHPDEPVEGLKIYLKDTFPELV